MTMARFQSRYQALHYILPDGHSVIFREGQYTTEDPAELSVLRDICRTEARGNRACYEVDGVGDPVDPFRVGTPPPVPATTRERAHPSPPDGETPQTRGPAPDGAGVARAVASADAVAGHPRGR